MSRPAYSTALDAILAGGDIKMAFRILITDLDWPSGSPPYTGDTVQVPALGTPAAYDPATYDPDDNTVWTDVTALVAEYRWNQDAGLGVDQASFSVPAAWEDHAMEGVWREMRVIRVQERYTGSGEDTGWIEAYWGLSDGWDGRWDEKSHAYTVNAKNALKLANIDILGAAGQYVAFEGDRIQYGTYASHHTLDYIRDNGDAWEYGIKDGASPYGVHPNWADRPAPQFWIHNVPTSTDPVKCAIGGSAVQAVFGEGILRISKTWARTAPGGPDHDSDYTVGLGFASDCVPGGSPAGPDVRGVVSRFAHPATTDYLGAALPADVVDGLTVASSSAGHVVIASDLSAYPQGLTLMATDGSGRRWKTTSHSYSAPNTTFVLADSTSVDCTAGLAVTYGDANLATTVALRMLLGCGFQTTDPTAPLYVTVSSPKLSGSAVPIWLPALVYRDTENKTALAALEDLRQNGYLPPNYIARADGSGQITAGPVEQLSTGSGDILPITAPVAPAAVLRSELQVTTRYIARGLVRQITDEAQARSTSSPYPLTTALADVSGGLQRTPYGSYYACIKRTGEATTGVVYDLPQLLDLGAAPGFDETKRYPWLWYYRLTAPGKDRSLETTIRNLWEGKGLLDITLPAQVSIDSIELDMSSPWMSSYVAGKPILDPAYFGPPVNVKFYHVPNEDYKFWNATIDEQALAVQYFDYASNSWEYLISWISGARRFPDVQRISSADFDTRGPVTTDLLRIVCVQPEVAISGDRTGSSSGWYHFTVAAALSRVRVWLSQEIRGEAILGTTAPLNTTYYQGLYARLRQRTEVMASAVSWANTQPQVDDLALDWLAWRARDLAPKTLRAVRPEVRIWDTVSIQLPGEESAGEYLVMSHNHQVSQTGVIEDLTLTAY